MPFRRQHEFTTETVQAMTAAHSVRIVLQHVGRLVSRCEIAREIKDWSERKSEELSPGLSEWIDYQLDLGVRSKQRVEGAG